MKTWVLENWKDPLICAELAVCENNWKPNSVPGEDPLTIEWVIRKLYVVSDPGPTLLKSIEANSSTSPFDLCSVILISGSYIPL